MAKTKTRTANLTKRIVDSLPPQEKPYRVWDVGGRDSVKGLYIRVQPTGSKSYYLSYRNAENKQIDYLIGNADKISPVQARDAAKKANGEIALGIDIQAEKHRKIAEAKASNTKTLGVFVAEKYRPWMEANRKSGEAMIKRLMFCFDHLMDKQLDQISAWEVEKWRSEEKKRGKAASTINREVGILKAAFSKAVEWGVIEANPLVKVKPYKVDKRGVVRFLSDDEAARLRRALDEREEEIRAGRESGNKWREARGYAPYPSLNNERCVFADYLKPVVLLSLNTGLRRNEVFSLQWENVNFATRQITITSDVAKSALARHIDLNNEAYQTLRDWQKQQGKTSGLVFFNNKGEKIHDVRSSWGRVLKMANITNFRWHDMRHDFASRLVMAGVELNTVRELLGHSSITMTLRYAHLTPKHKAAGVAKLDQGNQANIARSKMLGETEEKTA